MTSRETIGKLAEALGVDARELVKDDARGISATQET